LSKEKAARIAAKKVKDKWKSKIWYTILATESFGKKEIGSTPASEPGEIIGRISEAYLSNLTGDFKLSHVKVYFRINKVEGDKAYTEFEGHEINQDYIRRLVRRRKTRIDSVIDVVTADGVKIRLKPLIILDRKVIKNVETNIRNAINEFLKEKASSLPLDQLVVYMLSTNYTNDAYEKIKNIYPTRKIELRKSEVLRENNKQETIEEAQAEAEV